MRIFITNKKEFEDHFNENPTSLSTKDIHKNLFNAVNNMLISDQLIELIVYIEYKKSDDGFAVFEFVGKNKDMFFYEFRECIIG